MTTVAYRDGVMAADTLVSSGDILRGETSKLWRMADGSLLGLCGQAGFGDVIVAWLHGGANYGERPVIPDDANMWGLWVRPDGTVYAMSSRLVLAPVEATFHAIGSGNELALGAMSMGASAEEAVEVAARFDLYTGGRIDKIALPTSSPRNLRKPS